MFGALALLTALLVGALVALGFLAGLFGTWPHWQRSLKAPPAAT
jgi:hypothetical protein